MHDLLYEGGFTIYPGKIDEQRTFRIANMGAIYPSDIKLFLSRMIDVLKEMGIDRVFYK